MDVYIQVVDSTTGQPISGAAVVLVDPTGNSTGNTTATADTGWFHFDDNRLAVGNGYDLVISAPGYQSGSIDPIDTFYRGKPVGLIRQAAIVTAPITNPITTPVTTLVQTITPTPLDPTVEAAVTAVATEHSNLMMWALIAVGAYLILK